MTHDIERIARGLTEAQRRVLTGDLERWMLREGSFRGVLSYLRAKGLQDREREFLSPTPLGLAVRSYLKEQEQ